MPIKLTSTPLANQAMKILLFEYITGGGFNKQTLPDALAREGQLMLQALLDDLSRLDNIQPVVMLDARFTGIIKHPFATVSVSPQQDCQAVFLQEVSQCAAVWPIAPEFDGILETLCREVERLGKRLLTSSAAAVALSADKWQTYQRLKACAVPSVATQRLDQFSYDGSGEWMVKALDGAGCRDSHLIKHPQDWPALDKPSDHYIIQPHLSGDNISLSALFAHGQGYLLCVNRQYFQLIDQYYQLTRIAVNYCPATLSQQTLLDKIAAAMPELSGYAGVDLIATADGLLVLEINPRLTTSYVGIYNATGINVAEQVINGLAATPNIQATRQQTVTLNL